MQQCGNCDYYSIDPETLKQGQCNVNPPTVFLVPMQKGIGINNVNAIVSCERRACRFFLPKHEAVN